MFLKSSVICRRRGRPGWVVCGWGTYIHVCMSKLIENGKMARSAETFAYFIRKTTKNMSKIAIMDGFRICVPEANLHFTGQLWNFSRTLTARCYGNVSTFTRGFIWDDEERNVCYKEITGKSQHNNQRSRKLLQGIMLKTSPPCEVHRFLYKYKTLILW